MRVIGLGWNREATAADVAAAVRAMVASTGDLSPDVAAAVVKSGGRSAVIVTACDELGLPLRLVTQEELAACAERCVTRSSASLASYGVPSVCEAAALAAGGEGARIKVPRRSYGRVTVAIAEDAS